MPDEKFVLNWDQHEQNRTSSLNSMWECQDFLDVTIACDDDQIDAHKVILSAASPFFRQILTRNSHNHPLLYIKGSTKKIMQSLLNFIYSGETHIIQEELPEFMALAHSLKVMGLVEEEHEINDETISDLKEKMKRKECLEEEYQLIKTAAYSEKAKDGIFKSRQKQRVKKVGELYDRYGTIEKYTGLTIIEEDESVSQTITNTSLTEYLGKVSELVCKTESGWSCQDCSYKGEYRSNLEEHVEKHIKGYSFDCKSCEKSFSRKASLRHHGRKCNKLNTE